jgi:hypothetical protein
MTSHPATPTTTAHPAVTTHPTVATHQTVATHRRFTPGWRGLLRRAVLAACGGLLIGAVLVSGSVPGSADPTTSPTARPTVSSTVSPTAAVPTPSGSVTAGSPACAGVQVPAAHHAHIWCVAWADNDVTNSVTCSRAAAGVDRDMCSAVRTDPTAGMSTPAASVLGGVDGVVHCELLDLAADHSPQPLAGHERASACRSFTAFLESRSYATQDTAPATCSPVDTLCLIRDEVAKITSGPIRDGVAGLVDVVVDAAVSALGELATLVFSASMVNLNDPSFYGVYNMVAGVAIFIVVALVLWSVARQALSTRRPGPVATVVGAGRAVLGVTWAAGIAWALGLFWDQLTDALINANSATSYDPGTWFKALVALAGPGGTMGIALLVSVFALLGLPLTLVIMAFRSVLFALGACYGAVAMAGQASAETQGWGRKWFWTMNALAATKFFWAMTWIYGSRAAVSGDNILVALSGLAVIWAMVACPFVLLRLSSMVDSYMADPDARVLVAAGTQALGVGDLAGRARDRLLGAKAPIGGGADIGAGEDGVSPASLMDTNLAGLGGNSGFGAGLEKAAAMRSGPAAQAVQGLERSGGPTERPEPGTASDAAQQSSPSDPGSPDAGANPAQAMREQPGLPLIPTLPGQPGRAAAPSPGSGQTGDSTAQAAQQAAVIAGAPEVAVAGALLSEQQNSSNTGTSGGSNATGGGYDGRGEG